MWHLIKHNGEMSKLVKEMDLKSIAQKSLRVRLPLSPQNYTGDAEKFSRLLSFDQVHAPHISLASDGEINFLWMLQDFRLDLGFYGDGTYSYYGRTTNGEEFMADDQPFDKALPDKIIQLIRKKSY